MTKKSHSLQKHIWLSIMYISWKNPVFFCCLFAWWLNVHSCRLMDHFMGQDASLIPKTHTRRARREFQFCLRHAWAVSYAGFVCCQISKRAERHGVFVSCAVRGTAYVTQHVTSDKKEKLLSVKSQKIMTSPTWSCKIRERQPRVFIHQRCVFQDAHSEAAFTLWRTHGTQIWGNPSASCTASSAPANL